MLAGPLMAPNFVCQQAEAGGLLLFCPHKKPSACVSKAGIVQTPPELLSSARCGGGSPAYTLLHVKAKRLDV